MPNYCENKLKVSGEEKDVEQFIEKVKGDTEPLQFGSLVPVPNELRGDGEVMSNELYEWRLRNWGTHWEPTDVEIDRYGIGVVYEFLTAWTPPIPWLEHVSKLFPNLQFKLFYEEEGMDLFGSWRSDGKDGYGNEETGHN